MNCDNSDSDFSDEDFGLQKRALYVEIPKNFDPSKIPANGEEYLQQVIYEARNCPSFTVAPLKSNQIHSTVQIPLKEKCIKAPKSMIPSMSWQDESLEEFTKFREFVFKKIETYPKTKHSGDLDLILSQNPTFSLVIGLSQEDKIEILENILKQLGQVKKRESISGRLALWLYSLLSTLDTPLCPDTCHVLREIARKCSQIRSGLGEEAFEEDYKALNLYVCLIARYFRQLDLADE